ncbi:hypothetical protein B0H10DRAFT_1951857 [Mycena sp. CBHHK59/15]|nr:hypothetical protein B0H10DRAFT_1951857 [Mycena sp. CBHHK59/15]
MTTLTWIQSFWGFVVEMNLTVCGILQLRVQALNALHNRFNFLIFIRDLRTTSIHTTIAECTYTTHTIASLYSEPLRPELSIHLYQKGRNHVLKFFARDYPLAIPMETPTLCPCARSSELWLDLLIGTSTIIFVWIGPHSVHLAICTDLEGSRSAENWSGPTGARSRASAKTTGERGRKGSEGRRGEQGFACHNSPARSFDLLADVVREREYKLVDFGRCFTPSPSLFCVLTNGSEVIGAQNANAQRWKTGNGASEKQDWVLWSRPTGQRYRIRSGTAPDTTWRGCTARLESRAYGNFDGGRLRKSDAPRYEPQNGADFLHRPDRKHAVCFNQKIPSIERTGVEIQQLASELQFLVLLMRLLIAGIMNQFPCWRGLKHLPSPATIDYSEEQAFVDILQLLPHNSRLIRIDVYQALGKDFNFLKQHSLIYSIEDFMSKGTSRNMNTRVGEGFQQEVEKMYQKTTGKNAERQANLDLEDGERIVIPVASGISSGHWRLGSPVPRVPPPRLEAERKNDTAFCGFTMRLREYIAQHHPAHQVRLEQLIQIEQCKVIYVEYQSKVDWRSARDILRCNPQDEDNPLAMAMVRPFRTTAWQPNTSTDCPIRELMPATTSRFAALEHVALLCQIFGGKAGMNYIICVDKDIYLRINNIN